MSPTLDQPAVRAYLDELRRLLVGAPDRDLVVEGVARHIEDALADCPADPARVQAVLDELGDPAAIAAESAPAASAEGASFLDRRGGAILTVLLLTIGGFVIPVFGWVAGLVLLWSSRGWNRVDKMIGTLALPAAIALLVLGRLLWPVSLESCGDTVGGGFCPPTLSGFSTVAAIPWLALLVLAAAMFLLVRFRPTRTAKGAR